MRVADYIAQFLVENGITDMFTVVGGGAMFLNDAFGANEKLNVIYNHHEQACAIAAEGYARLTQNVAAVCVTTGPGGINALTGVLGGWVDSIPMLVISGQVKYSTTVASTDVPVRQLGDQEWPIVDTVKNMTKYSVMVTDPLEISYHLEKALWLATNGRPGPSWIDVPINVQSADIDPVLLEHFSPSEEGQESLPKWEIPSKIASADIHRVLEEIKAAKAPVILAGGGIRTAKAFNEFKCFVDKFQIPVCTAWNAHDLMEDDDPLYAGRPGTVGTRGGNFVIQNADLVISLACRMNIRQISYNWENFAKNAKIIAVDIDEAELSKPTLNIDMPIHADVKSFLLEVNKATMELEQGHHASWIAWCREVNNKYPANLPEYADADSPVNPYLFLDRLSRHLGNEVVTVCSNGAACVCSFQAMRISGEQRLFTNSGMASMGYGLPAALGAAVAQKGKPVVCIEGDGSIMMNLQELETMSYNKLNMKLVILNNDGYHSIRQTQANTFNRHFCGMDGDSGVGFPRWEKIARAFDIPYCRIDTTEDIEKKLEGFLDTDGPVMCEAVVGHAQDFEPKLSSRKLDDGTIVSPTLEDMSPFLERSEFESIRFSM